MLIDTLQDYIDRSNNLRAGYKDSLGNPLGIPKTPNLPQSIEAVYRCISGTPYATEQQMFMDFIPGYLIIHNSEFQDMLDKMRSLIDSEKEYYFPILADYASTFFAVKINKLLVEEGVYYVAPEEIEPVKAFASFEKLLETFGECYNQKAYSIDDDGFLEVDFELEEQVICSMNPNMPYWN